MKNIIRTSLMLAIIIACIVPSQPTVAMPVKAKSVAKRTMVDFIAENATSSAAYLYLRNTVTDEEFYFYVPANTPSGGTVIGQIPQTNDSFYGSVQIVDQTPHNIHLYSNYEYNTNFLEASDMAIGCSSCAYVRIGY